MVSAASVNRTAAANARRSCDGARNVLCCYIPRLSQHHGCESQAGRGPLKFWRIVLSPMALPKRSNWPAFKGLSPTDESYPTLKVASLF